MATYLHWFLGGDLNSGVGLGRITSIVLQTHMQIEEFNKMFKDVIMLPQLQKGPLTPDV